MSLPTIADVLVDCVPVNCMPSPESPAKRIVTVSNSSIGLSMVSTGGSSTARIVFLLCPLDKNSDCPSPIGALSIGNHQSKIVNDFILHPRCSSPARVQAADSSWLADSFPPDTL